MTTELQKYNYTLLKYKKWIAKLLSYYGKGQVSTLLINKCYFMGAQGCIKDTTCNTFLLFKKVND